MNNDPMWLKTMAEKEAKYDSVAVGINNPPIVPSDEDISWIAEKCLGMSVTYIIRELREVRDRTQQAMVLQMAKGLANAKRD